MPRAKWLVDYLIELKTKPCVDCLQVFPPYVMEFDHVKGKKAFTIAKYIRRGKCDRKLLDKELAKTQLVCANCHRIRTFTRLAK